MYIFSSTQRVVEAKYAQYPLRVFHGDIIKFDLKVEMPSDGYQCFKTMDDVVKEFARRILHGTKVDIYDNTRND